VSKLPARETPWYPISDHRPLFLVQVAGWMWSSQAICVSRRRVEKLLCNAVRCLERGHCESGRVVSIECPMVNWVVNSRVESFDCRIEYGLLTTSQKKLLWHHVAMGIHLPEETGNGDGASLSHLLVLLVDIPLLCRSAGSGSVGAAVITTGAQDVPALATNVGDTVALRTLLAYVVHQRVVVAALLDVGMARAVCVIVDPVGAGIRRLYPVDVNYRAAE